MTKPFRPLALFGLLAALTLPALAGGPRGGPGFDRHLQDLDLTVEQREQIKEIRQSRASELREARIETRSADRSLSEAIEAGADESTIATLAIARHDAQRAARELRASTRADVQGVLTEEQIAELKDRRRQRGAQKGNRGQRGMEPGHRGPRGR